MLKKMLYLTIVISVFTYAQNQITGPVVGIATKGANGLFECKMTLHIANRESDEVQIRLREKGAKEHRDIAMQPFPRKNRDYPTLPPQTALLNKLKPGSTYEYEIFLNNSSAKIKGTFKTPSATSSSLKVALASCIKYRYDQVQEGWKRLYNANPDFVMLVGDNVYADSTDHTKLWQHHQQQRSVENFRRILHNFSMTSIWDDHDYGPNDSNGSAIGKEHSLAAFREIWWSNPAHGNKNIEGTFYRFSWNKVHFFVLDGRFHRTSAFSSKATMLGHKQRDWVLAELKKQQQLDKANGTSSFKVIISGSVLTDNPLDGWLIYPEERAKLFGGIMEAGISGVIYCGGDVHWSYINKHGVSHPKAYPLYEVVSSGMANGHPIFGYTQSFATLSFDTAAKDALDHTIIMKIHGAEKFLAQNKRIINKKISLRDLQVKQSNQKAKHVKFLYSRKSQEYQERLRKNNLIGEYSAPMPK